jgi:type III pantothenate kinase
MSLLCIDCGNTRAKWGVHDGHDWLQKGSASYDELPALAVSAERILACNVAGERGRRAVEALAQRHERSVEWLRAVARQGGVINGYDRPEQLGADRWAALLAARDHHDGPCLVVSAGTATTVDFLDVDGVFRGGLILPGLALMRRSLATGTADLPDDAGTVQPWPTNTADAITSGAMAATVAAIERQFLLAGPGANAVCLLAGGNAAVLRPQLSIPCRLEPDLVLAGLFLASR